MRKSFAAAAMAIAAVGLIAVAISAWNGLERYDDNIKKRGVAVFSLAWGRAKSLKLPGRQLPVKSVRLEFKSYSGDTADFETVYDTSSVLSSYPGFMSAGKWKLSRWSVIGIGMPGIDITEPAALKAAGVPEFFEIKPSTLNYLGKFQTVVKSSSVFELRYSTAPSAPAYEKLAAAISSGTAAPANISSDGKWPDGFRALLGLPALPAPSARKPMDGNERRLTASATDKSLGEQLRLAYIAKLGSLKTDTAAATLEKIAADKDDTAGAREAARTALAKMKAAASAVPPAPAEDPRLAALSSMLEKIRDKNSSAEMRIILIQAVGQMDEKARPSAAPVLKAVKDDVKDKSKVRDAAAEVLARW